MDDGVDFDATLLPARLRMPPNALEDDVGEQGYCRGVYDPKPFYPLLYPVPSASI